MSYTHKGLSSIDLAKDPIDVDSTDWVYFVYEDWLRADEVITDHSALITGGEIVTDSVYIGSLVDESGVEHTDVYGVQFSVESDSTEVSITHRISTETLGAVDIGRLNIDHTIVVPVEVL